MKFLARSVQPEHFPPELRRVYEVALIYFTKTMGVVTPKAFREILISSGMDTALREAYERTLVKLYKLPKITDPTWRWSVHGMREDRQQDLFIEALSDTMRVLTEGLTDRSGERRYGYKSARAQLNQELSRIDRLQADVYPAGNVMEEASDVLEDYRRRKAEGIHYGVGTGFETVDRITFGAQRGEFWLVAAYAGEGKTQLLTNIAYNAVMDGKNVVFITLETLRDQVRRRFYTRHGSHPKFDRAEALDYSAMKSGSLSEGQEKTLQLVVEDLRDWQAQKYGRLEVDWLPRGSTPVDVQIRGDVYGSMFEVDLMLIDYAGLMDASRRTERRQEALVEVLQGLKGVATSHGNGQGVPVISAYQTSRHARDDARRSGGYSLDALAETAEAERSADLVWTLLKMEDESREVKGQLLKYRDGTTLQEFYMDIDYARSLVTDRRDDQGGGEEEDLGGLLG